MSNSPDIDSQTSVSEHDIRKVASISLIGASVEWFDFFLFGTAAALVFPTVFFGGNKESVLLSFGALAVGFLARPLGGILWGHYGDRMGRKQAFQAALTLMAVSTFLIGVLPGSNTIGLAAPILLTLLRFSQGIAVGGQWGGAALLATETAPAHRRGFYGSFAQLGVPIGALLGVTAYFFLFVFMGKETFLSYGWRIPFIASVIFVGIVLWTKSKLEETPEFKRLQAKAAELQAQKASAGEVIAEKSPILEVLTKHWQTVLLSGGAYTVTTAVYYLYIVFMLEYTVSTLGMTQAQALLPISIANLVMVAIIPLTAAWSDKIGRAPLYIGGGIGTALWAFPFFALANTKNMVTLTIAMIIGMAFLATMYGLMAAFFAELFPPAIRYSGASMGYQLGSVIGGAAAPLVAVALVERSGSTNPVAFLIIALSVVSVLCTIALKRRPIHSN